MVRRVVLVVALAAGLLASASLGVFAQTTTTGDGSGSAGATASDASPPAATTPASTTPSPSTTPSTTTAGTSTTPSSSSSSSTGTACPATSVPATPVTTTPTVPTTTTPAADSSAGSATATAGCSKTPSLSLGFSVPVSGLALKPGGTSTAKGAVIVDTTAGGWTLSAVDASGSAHPGHLVRSGQCDLGVPYLTDPLYVQASPVGGQSFGSAPLSASATALASGGASASVNLDFSQSVGSGEALATGCSYALTISLTLS